MANRKNSSEIRLLKELGPSGTASITVKTDRRLDLSSELTDMDIASQIVGSGDKLNPITVKANELVSEFYRRLASLI